MHIKGVMDVENVAKTCEALGNYDLLSFMEVNPRYREICESKLTKQQLESIETTQLQRSFVVTEEFIAFIMNGTIFLRRRDKSEVMKVDLPAKAVHMFDYFLYTYIIDENGSLWLMEFRYDSVILDMKIEPYPITLFNADYWGLYVTNDIVKINHQHHFSNSRLPSLKLPPIPLSNITHLYSMINYTPTKSQFIHIVTVNDNHLMYLQPIWKIGTLSIPVDLGDEMELVSAVRDDPYNEHFIIRFNHRIIKMEMIPNVGIVVLTNGRLILLLRNTREPDYVATSITLRNDYINNFSICPWHERVKYDSQQFLVFVTEHNRILLYSFTHDLTMTEMELQLPNDALPLVAELSRRDYYTIAVLDKDTKLYGLLFKDIPRDPFERLEFLIPPTEQIKIMTTMVDNVRDFFKR